MTERWERWVAVLERKEPAHALALVRIFLAITILSFLLDLGLSGVLPLVWLGPEHGGYRTVNETWWLVALLGGATPSVVWGLYGAAVVSALALLLGLGGPVTPLLLGQLLMALFSLNTESGGGHDRVMTCALFILVFSGASKTLSLPARFLKGEWAPAVEVSAWPRWVLLYQLGLIYTSTGMQKVGSDWLPWGGLNALYYALQLPEWARFDNTWAAHPILYQLTRLGTVATWLFEWTGILWVLAVYYAETPDRPGRLRRWSNRIHFREGWLLLGLGLHFGIWATMNVGPFSAAMVSLYPCAMSGWWWCRRFRVSIPARAVERVPA